MWEFRRFEYEISGGPKPVHVSISGVPVFDDEGGFVGYRGTGTDVTDLKEKERQLAEANRNFGDSVAYASSIQRTSCSSRCSSRSSNRESR